MKKLLAMISLILIVAMPLFIGACDAGNNSGCDSNPTPTPTPGDTNTPVTTVFQAEDATIVSGVVESEHAGYTGSGYANTGNAAGNYLSETSILGYGDNVLTTGALFFNNCEMGSTYGPHVWPRNTETNHGVVFLNSRFYTVGDVLTDIARSPTNHGINYPYAEVVVLNCTLEGLRPGGWGAVGPDTANIHFWEYNSVDASGRPADVSQRVSWSKQLTMAKDAKTIANYSNPAYVLGGWTPELPAAVMTQLSDK